MTVSVTFWIAALVLLVRDVNTGPKSGPYDIMVKRLEVCEDVGSNQVKFGMRMRSKGYGVLSYTDDVKFEMPWDDKLKADIEVQQMRNGVYTPKYFTQNFKNCEKMWKYAVDLWRGFFHAAGYNFTSCPLPAGTYPVRDWPLNITFNNLPSFIYGTYKLIVSFSKDKKRVGCFMVFGDVVPKNT